MLYFLLIYCTKSLRFSYTIQQGNVGYAQSLKSYNEAFLTFPAGEALMMVEWEDAILSLSIPSANIENLQFSKHSGYSLFTFKNAGTALITFKTDISFFYFSAPYMSTGAALQYITNYKSNALRLNTDYEIYIGAFGKYNVDASLSTNKKGGLYIYYTNAWKEHDNVESIHLQDVSDISILRNAKNEIKYQGTINFDCTFTFTPSVPTKVQLKYGKVQSNQYLFNGNNAYGGNEADESGKSIQLNVLNQRQFMIIHNRILVVRSYQLYIRIDGGEYQQINYDQTFKEERNSEFSAEIFLASTKCTKYSLIQNVNSSKWKLDSDGLQEVLTIDDSFIPDYCKIDEKKKVNVFLIVTIILAIIVVALIIVVIVIAVLYKKRKSSHSSQEGNTAETV